MLFKTSALEPVHQQCLRKQYLEIKNGRRAAGGDGGDEW
jgi:hypothetical protein